MSTFNYPKITNEIPKLSPFDRTYYKSQRFVVRQHTDLEENTKLENMDFNPIHSLNKYVTGTNPSGLFNSTNMGNNGLFSTSRQKYFNRSFPARLPQWLKYDKSVLNFTGYFQEHVSESAYENYRIRKCSIFYYLEDDTMHID